MTRHPFEPFKIKATEPIPLSTRRQREAWARRAHLNLFALKAQEVTIDLLTDSGTSAMSQEQWAALMVGDESYAGARSFQRFEETVRRLTGFPHVIPAHQGRAAEHLLFSAAVQEGDLVPNNTHFDTTGANVRLRGAVPVNLPAAESLDAESPFPFKGNMDAAALRKLLSAERRRIPLVLVTLTNNSVGGHPVSMRNLREVSRTCRRFGVPLILDACRYAENAWLVKCREKGYARKTTAQIAREAFDLADGMTMSAKKDALVNIGGFFATRDADLARRVRETMVVIEGFPTYGGLAGRDLEAMATGLDEGLDEAFLAARTGQVAYLAGRLTEAGVPILQPPGGHAVFVNARKFCPHIPQSQFPGQALCVALYLAAGVRAVEVGSVMFAEEDPNTGKILYPRMELVRLAIPRRVYTQSHIDYVADALIELYARRKEIRGLRFTYKPPRLRHFLARYAWV